MSGDENALREKVEVMVKAEKLTRDEAKEPLSPSELEDEHKKTDR